MSWDLLILIADQDMKAAVDGILKRRQTLGLRELTCKLLVHNNRDSGCRVSGVDMLRPFTSQCAHALILFDHHGSGKDSQPAEALERDIEGQLENSGWQHAAAIVIAPELENWVWSDSPHVETVLGWNGKTPALKEWLTDKGWLQPGATKPIQPKEAMLAVFEQTQKRQSSSLYADLASRVSLSRCNDRAFLKLKNTLQAWFSASPGL